MRRFVVARSAWFEDLQPTLIASAQEAGLSLASEEVAPPGEIDGAGATVLEFVHMGLNGCTRVYNSKLSPRRYVYSTVGKR